MAAMSAKGPIRDGSISKSVHNILVYLCAKFGAFMKKCTIGLLICPTTSINAETWHELAEDRTAWRKAVKKGVRSFEDDRVKCKRRQATKTQGI